MSFAFVFPGQGSQSVGMLASLGAEPLVRETFEEASNVLGYDLWQLIQQGPAERLNATEQTQPAMLASGVALWRLWRHRGGGEAACMAALEPGEDDGHEDQRGSQAELNAPPLPLFGRPRLSRRVLELRLPRAFLNAREVAGDRGCHRPGIPRTGLPLR